MSYDINKPISSKRQTLEKGQNTPKSCSFRHQMKHKKPRSDVFPYTLRTYHRAKNFSLLTSFGRNYVA